MIIIPKIVLEAVLEAKLAPRGAQIGCKEGWEAQKLPEGGERDRQEGAKVAQEGPEDAHLEALGADLGRKLEENCLKFGSNIRKYRKRRI